MNKGKFLMNKRLLFPATSSLDALLTSGGDDRLSVDESMGLNKYGCSPYPEGVAPYSFTTASSISMGAYMHVAALFNDLQEFADADFYDWAALRFKNIKSRLVKTYGIPEKNKFFFGASGTDLELVALCICAASEEKLVHNIVVGAEETGSGIKYVSKGQYYESRTVLGKRVEVGASIPGFEKIVGTGSHVAIREADGNERSSKAVIEDITKAVEISLSKNQRPLIHLVHRSKTGLIQPQHEELQGALEQYSGMYDVVVDACQGRISTKKINRYLQNGFMVLYTGSKFFGGPPFSGVLMVPDSCTLLSPQSAPAGLAHFFTETEFIDLKNIDGLCSSKINLGLILRWEAALYEIEQYFSIDRDACTKVVDTFCDAVERFTEKSSLFNVLDSRDLSIKPSQVESDPLDMDSIYTFEIVPPLDYGIRLEYAVALEVYHSLNQDISRLVPRAETGAASFRLRLGQPVKSHPMDGDWKPTLRVSLGAPLISELHFLDKSRILERFMSDFRMLENKTDLILRMAGAYW